CCASCCPAAAARTTSPCWRSAPSRFPCATPSSFTGPMARIEPLHAIRYEPRTAGALENLVAPPYDVIDERMRKELTDKSPFNIVEVDLPVDERGGDPYFKATNTYDAWLQQGVLVKEREPSIWVMRQQFKLGDRTLQRTGFFA